MMFLKLVILHLRRLLTDRRVISLNLLMPTLVICMVVFFTKGQSNTTKMYIDIVNKDNGVMGASLIRELKSSENINVYELSKNEVMERVKNNVTDGAILIPEDFSRSIKENREPQVKLLKLNAGDTNMLTESKINGFIASHIIADKLSADVKVYKNVNINKLAKDLVSEVNNKKISVSVKEVTKDNNSSLSGQFSIGLIISFMMYTVLFIVLEMTSRKGDGTLRRSLSTPISAFSFSLSMVASFIIVGWVQVLLMIGSTKLLFHLSWGSNYLGLFVLFTALIMVVLTLGLLICRVVKSESSISVVANLIVTVTCMLGGSFMPLSYFPDFLKKIACFTPQSWAVSALTDLTLKNKGLISILPNVGILLLFAVAFFTAGVSYMKVDNE